VDERFFTVGTEYTVPERYLARIPGARLIGETGLVLLPDGAFTSEVTFTREHLVQQPAYLARLPRKAHRKRGDYFSLLSLWAHQPNYYHWIHDAMLRLHLLLPHLPNEIRFIVPPDLRPFQLDSLGLLGISPDRLCAYAGKELWELEALYFAPTASSAGSNSPAAIRWFRELAWSTYGFNPAAGTRRIYISRRRTRYRRIVNEPEIERVLSDFGFETCLLEDLELREQVELMTQAEAIVSASGAALTNMIFAPPGAKILVMVEPVQVSPFFWTMSEAAGHQYWYALGETVAVLPPPYDADLFVPPNKVVQTLEAMFAST
jgi:capsular polysaccharide biosynthesis protein